MTLEDAKRIVAAFAREYNEARLYSALGYITPKDMLEGRQQQNFADRDCKLEQARQRRAQARQAVRKTKETQKPPTAHNRLKSQFVLRIRKPEDKALMGSNLSTVLRSKTGEAASLPLAANTSTCF